MTKKAKQLLSILGRENATLDCTLKTQEISDTKKNEREALDKIVKDILYLKSISDNKIKNAVNFIGGNDTNDAKMCVKCFKAKEISEFYQNSTNKKVLHCWCRDCRRDYDKNYSSKK